MDTSCVEHDLKSFISENFMFGEDLSSIQNSDSLIENGIVDSLGIVQLVDFIQSKYVSTEIDSDEIVPENFDSIDNIKKFIETKIQ